MTIFRFPVACSLLILVWSGHAQSQDAVEVDGAEASADRAAEAILNGRGEEFAKELLAKTLTERLQFLDLSYVVANGEDQRDGWNAKYNLNYRAGSDQGFSVASGVASLKQSAVELDINGAYSYGSADNAEDFSTAKFGFNYLYGEFGRIRLIGREESIEFQQCTLDALQIPDPTAAEAANDACFAMPEIMARIDDPSQAYVLSLTATAGVEGDQSYQRKNTTYGLRGLLSYGAWPSLRLDLEHVDAGEDEERTALTDDVEYDRASLEIGYTHELVRHSEGSTLLYLSYRYFKEFSAPDAIRTADLDEFDFVSASIRIPANVLDFVETDDFYLYVRFTDGQLPFDRESAQSVQLGISTNISVLAKLLPE